MLGLQTHNQTDLFKLALGLQNPWQVSDIVFSKDEGRLDIYLTYAKGAKFSSACCGISAGVYDSVDHTWRHLNFFQYQTYLHAKLPRIKCQCGHVKNATVPWARPDSGFTLLFEAFAMELAQAMPLATVGGILGEYDTRLMRIVNHYVKQARTKMDMSSVKAVGIDETSKAKGHDYVTVFIDILKAQVLYVTSGKDSSTIGRFVGDLVEHGGCPLNIKQACTDLSPAFKKGISDHLPDTEIIFDRFHVMKLVNEALDETRREEQKDNQLLLGSRYAWLHNPETNTAKQRQQLESLTKLNLKTARAYQIRLALKNIYEMHYLKNAERALRRWYFWATHSRIQPIIEVAKTIKRHWSGILAFFESRIANGLAEGINSVIQVVKRRARGYANTDNFITMIYLNCSKLNFNLPQSCGVTPR
jgi:transposase